MNRLSTELLCQDLRLITDLGFEGAIFNQDAANEYRRISFRSSGSKDGTVIKNGNVGIDTTELPKAPVGADGKRVLPGRRQLCGHSSRRSAHDLADRWTRNEGPRVRARVRCNPREGAQLPARGSSSGPGSDCSALTRAAAFHAREHARSLNAPTEDKRMAIMVSLRDAGKIVGSFVSIQQMARRYGLSSPLFLRQFIEAPGRPFPRCNCLHIKDLSYLFLHSIEHIDEMLSRRREIYAVAIIRVRGRSRP